MLPLLLLGTFLLGSHADQDWQVSDLRVESLRSPSGVDTNSPRFSWKNVAASRGSQQTQYKLELMNADNSVQLWSTTREGGASVLQPYKGPLLDSDTPYTWRVQTWAGNLSASASASFSTGLLSADWKGAKWIAGGDGKNLLRKTFTVGSGMRRASIFISGVGYHVLYVNGVRVGSFRRLDVAPTDYAKRVYYSSYDVTEFLKPGANAVGVMLGNGWFAKAGGMPNSIDSPPQLLFLMNIHGDQPSSVISDESWVAKEGPVKYDSLYNGETYDATAEIPGWASLPFDASSWSPVTRRSELNNAVLSSQLFEPISEISRLIPKDIRQPLPGVTVVDFGQNFAGYAQLKMRGRRGQNVTLRHAELLNHPPYGPADGTIYVGNLRGAKATDVYTMAGMPNGETYQPRFTQHGFRFLEITGLDYMPTEHDILGIEVHTFVEEGGSVSFDVELLNKIQHNVVWGQKSNLMGMPTDCDQRDERRGWSGDAALTAEEANYNFEMGAFYTHYLRIIGDDQVSGGDDDGAIPNIVPPAGGPGAPNWESVFPTMLWSVMRFRQDRAVAKEHYSRLQRYFGFWERKYNSTGIGNFMTGFGDWVPPPPAARADGHLLGAFAYLHDLKLGIEVATALNETSDAVHWNDQFQKVGLAFHKQWYNESKGYYKSGLQTEQALPLWLGIVPKNLEQKVLNYMIADIKAHGNHTTCGIVGVKFQYEVLSKLGRGDVAMWMALQDTYPSYGYMIQGKGNPEPATTIWEIWDADKEGPGMNSRNHIMYGTISSWFYRYVLGIDALALPSEGTPEVKIAPDAAVMGSSSSNRTLETTSGSVLTPFGHVSSSWSLKVASGSECGLAKEDEALQVSCHGSTIKSVEFASFGTPSGDCTEGFSLGKCHSNQSQAVVEGACLGKSSCSVTANDAAFGDPCYGTQKALAVEVACNGRITKPVLGLTASIPPGLQAELHVPVLEAGEAALVTEGGGEADVPGVAEVWSKGAFAPGRPGILSAAWNSDKTAVVFRLSSGRFNFAVSSSNVIEQIIV